MEGRDTELEERVKRWREKIEGIEARPTEIALLETKWVSEKWAKAKLGVQE